MPLFIKIMSHKDAATFRKQCEIEIKLNYGRYYEVNSSCYSELN